MKKTIRLTESELRHMISDSVRKTLNEINDKYDFENRTFDEKYNGENTYLQVAMLGSPESYETYGGNEVVTNSYIKKYNTLSSNPPEKVLDLWRTCAYESNVVRNMPEDDKFIVEEDADGIYLMIRVDNKEDFKQYQRGNW